MQRAMKAGNYLVFGDYEDLAHFLDPFQPRLAADLEYSDETIPMPNLIKHFGNRYEPSLESVE